MADKQPLDQRPPKQGRGRTGIPRAVVRRNIMDQSITPFPMAEIARRPPTTTAAAPTTVPRIPASSEDSDDDTPAIVTRVVVPTPGYELAKRARPSSSSSGSSGNQEDKRVKLSLALPAPPPDYQDSSSSTSTSSSSSTPSRRSPLQVVHPPPPRTESQPQPETAAPPLTPPPAFSPAPASRHATPPPTDARRTAPPTSAHPHTHSQSGEAAMSASYSLSQPSSEQPREQVESASRPKDSTSYAELASPTTRDVQMASPVGVAKNISQKMCSVYVGEVTQALTHQNMINKYIRFPDTPAARQAVSQRKYGIPGVVGCVDGSHFKIVVLPRDEEHLYYSRKHYHSLNVQMVCDDEYRILTVNPKFGGANHDSFIWENSDVNRYMQSLHENGEMVWLLGDSAYPQRPWLMTPILDATQGTPEAHYNEKHMKARVVIENTFSRLKNRWRYLHKDKVLHYTPIKCARIILACSVLHNIIINFGIEDSEEDMDLELERIPEDVSDQIRHIEREATSGLIRGRILRDQLVRRLQ